LKVEREELRVESWEVEGFGVEREELRERIWCWGKW